MPLLQFPKLPRILWLRSLKTSLLRLSLLKERSVVTADDTRTLSNPDHKLMARSKGVHKSGVSSAFRAHCFSQCVDPLPNTVDTYSHLPVRCA